MQPMSPSRTPGHRLPHHVLPHRYELELAPDLEAATFAGTVSIDLEVRETTDTILLHALDLDIATAWVRPEGSPAALDATVELDADHEMVRLQLATDLRPGTAELHLDFTGTLNDQLVGFYRSTSVVDGEPLTLAVTQFESTHARRAFPCFDEPEFKARFGISLVVADGLTAVSNAAEVARETLGDGRVRVTFADTMRMSTYLFAVVVGPLEVTPERIVDGRDGPIPLRVVHPPGSGHLCEFALDVAEAALLFFEDYYELAYPGDKVDLVAVPDFAFGAMENLGCVTFREVLLLVDPATATPQELQRVAQVIDHELAHMWFGDLVTMRWWNGIWLNEAFATFMEVMATDAYRPEWDVWSTFGLARAAAFDTDSLASTRPIEYEVLTAEDAEGMFDVLTYEKGCSVVRMLEQYLGPRIFRDGIRAYLRLNAYGSTETTDLWDALEEVSGEPVRRIMDAWIFRGGHPIVTVAPSASGVALSQRRALLSGVTRSDDGSHDGSNGSGGDDPPWPVPVVLHATTTDGAATAHKVLLESPLEIDLGAPAARVQPNVGGNGFYRSVLHGDLLAAAAADDGTPLERFVLVDDTWFAVLAGLLPLERAAATVAEVAHGEASPAVWRRIAAVCAEAKRLVGDAGRPAAAALAARLAVTALGALPSPRDAEGDDAELAGVLLSLAGATGEHEGTRELAAELFAEGGAHPAVAAGCLEVVAARASGDVHAEIERRWREAPTPQEEQRHLAALVATDNEPSFRRAIDLVVAEARTQDAPYVLRRALTNRHHAGIAWARITDEWDDLVTRLPSSSLPRMLEGVRTVTDPAQAADVTAFLDSHPLPTGAQQVAQHLERMAATVAAAQRLDGTVIPAEARAERAGIQA